jgi:hypothetical protein
VVLFEPRPGARIGREQAVDNNHTISTVAGDAPVLLVARISGIVHMDRQAREISARYADDHYRKVALVVGSPMSRMLAGFFMGLNKPTVPTRMFGDDASAVTWLLGTAPHT